MLSDLACSLISAWLSETGSPEKWQTDHGGSLPSPEQSDGSGLEVDVFTISVLLNLKVVLFRIWLCDLYTSFEIFDLNLSGLDCNVVSGCVRHEHD